MPAARCLRAGLLALLRAADPAARCLLQDARPRKKRNDSDDDDEERERPKKEKKKKRRDDSSDDADEDVDFHPCDGSVSQLRKRFR